MDIIKKLIGKVVIRKLAMTAAATGTIEGTWPMAAVACLLCGESGGGGYVG